MRAAATSTAFSLLSPTRLRTSTPTTTGLPFRRRLRLAAMATDASSFRPEAARSPPAVEPPAPPLSKFKVALCQLSVTADKARNIARARAAIESAAADGAKLVLLPEIWNGPYSNDSFPEYAEDIEAGGDAAPSYSMMSDVARSLQITLVGGSISERSGNSLYNTCCVFGSDGKLKGKHRKVHLFDIDIPGKITFQESKTLTSGQDLTIVDTDVGRIGIGICYDIRSRNWQCSMLQERGVPAVIGVLGTIKLPYPTVIWQKKANSNACHKKGGHTSKMCKVQDVDDIWYTMVPASLYLGFTASIIWVGQGTYLTSAALSHARDNSLPEGPTLGSFNGEFWGVFASTQVIGNLISLALLRNGKDGGGVTGKNLLFVVFLGCMIIGIVLMCLLSRRDEKRDNASVHSSFGAMLKYIVAPLKDRRMILLIPLIAYSGLQQAFVWAVFTKSIVTPVLGISGVGGAMAIYGASDVVCSLVAGRFTSGLHSATFIVSVGAILQAAVLFWLLVLYSPMEGLLGAAVPLFIGALWGVGDGVLNTQLSALLGLLFEDVKEAAFAQLKVWQSGAIAVIFFLSPSITLQAMLILMATSLFISFGSFLLLTLVVEKPSPIRA